MSAERPRLSNWSWRTKYAGLDHAVHPRPRSVSLLAVIVAWGVVFAVASVWALWGRVEQAQGLAVYFLLWLSLGLACLWFSTKLSISARTTGQRDVFEVPIYLSLTSLGLIAIFGVVPYLRPDQLVIQLPSVNYLPVGLLLTGTGLVSLWLGYGLVALSRRPGALAQPPHDASSWDFTSPALMRTIWLYAVLAMLRIGLLAVGSGEQYNATPLLGDWQQWLTYALELRWVFMALIFLQVARGKWPRSLLLITLVFEVMMAILSGLSSTLLKIAIVVVGCYAYYHRRVSLRYLLLGLASLLTLVALARFTRQAETRQLPSLVDTAVSGAETYLTSGAQVTWAYSWDLLIQRQSVLAQTPAIILHMTPTPVPYRPLSEVLLVPFSLVPRALWPSKPAYGVIGGYVTTVYFGLDPSFGSSDPTTAASAYMYGGWLPVIVGMFLLGVVCAALYRWLVAPALSDRRVGLLAIYVGVVITNFHIGEGDLIGIWQGIVQRLLVFFILMAVLCFKKRSYRGAAVNNVGTRWP